jgi:glutamate--cysteine ligase
VVEELGSADDVRGWLAANVYAPDPAAPPTGRVGVEAELFPFWIAPGGRPAARLALVEIAAVVDDIPDAIRDPDRGDGRPSWRLDGALITEEPGAQIEVVGPPLADAHEALAHLESIIDGLTAAFDAVGAGLAAVGLDRWSADDEVPVQLDVPRYRAMTAYFGRRGGRYGHLLMCSSCSVQVNVDLGPPGTARRRWLLANLAAPVLTAAFSTSPTPQAVNGRALGWRRLDPTRTGVPPSLVTGQDDPLEHALEDAWRADVLLVQREDGCHAGEPGWRFGNWVQDGHPQFGRPTTDDLATHLSTLFPEARLRGYLEIRCVDQLPRPWRDAAVALVVGLFYDEAAVEEALALLLPHRPALPDLLERSAVAGLEDPIVRTLSGEVLEAALRGAGRLGLPEAAVAEAFLARYARQGRHPADDLATAHAQGPDRAFAWSRAAHRTGG